MTQQETRIVIEIPWFNALASQIPDGWSPVHEALKPGEILQGPVPEDLMNAYFVAVWSLEKAAMILDEHEIIDAEQGRVQAVCRSTEVRVADLRNRGEILQSAVFVGLRDCYQLDRNAAVAVRLEGVVTMQSLVSQHLLVDL